MSISCDDVHYQPVPLGTALPCGCVARATLMVCETCSNEQWLGGPTDVEVGGHARIKGFCPVCGAAFDQLTTVHKQPIPEALRRR